MIGNYVSEELSSKDNGCLQATAQYNKTGLHTQKAERHSERMRITDERRRSEEGSRH